MLTRSMLAGLPRIAGEIAAEIRPSSRFLKRNSWSCVRWPQRRMTFATSLGLFYSGKTMAPKRKRGEKAESEPAGSEKASKSKKAKPAPKNKTQTDLSTIDFSCDAVSKESKPWNFKITSWNVNGLRAIVEKNGFDFLKHENPDVICLQETKCPKEKIPDGVAPDGYTEYWLNGDTEGYSGVGLISKTKPLSVTYGIGDEEHDQEGRVITAEYKDFYVVSAYVPNAGKKLVRLKYRMEWDKAFREYLVKKDEKKPVILCGDLNVAHLEIDLANPKTNKRNAGFTQEERDGFSELLKVGFVDSFRDLHPDETGAYTFWTYMMNARAKNVGWRLDYFVISEKLGPQLCESVIRKDVLGSDHCPITLFMST